MEIREQHLSRPEQRVFGGLRFFDLDDQFGLFEERGKKFAYLTVPNAKAKKVDVRTGLRNETEVEILSGLAEGSTVYTDKPLNLQEDAPAKPAAAQSAKKGS